MHAMQTVTMKSVIARVTTFKKYGWPFTDDHPRLSAHAMAKAGFFRENDRWDYVRCFLCNITVGQWNSESDLPMQKHKDQCQIVDVNARMGCLKLRYESFQTHGWPFPETHPYLSAYNMAMAGLYRINDDKCVDSVRCYMCCVIINHWDGNNDGPISRHALVSPECINNGLSGGISSNKLRIRQTENGNLSIPIVYPLYVNMIKRLNSFPRTFGLSEKVSTLTTIFRAYICTNRKSLALNGFFCKSPDLLQTYKDEKYNIDLVVCYACGFSLPYFLPSYNITHESMHAHRNPDCWHIITTCGSLN
nr:inhibitor of apoptosis 3 [Apis mellifera nudivirus]